MVSAASTAEVLASPEAMLAWRDAVMDPEVPVLSVVDLGTVRDLPWQPAALPGAV